MQIPTINLQDIDEQALGLIDAACRDHGFFLLTGHGLNDQIDQVLDVTNAFFKAPRDFKLETKKEEGDAFGYIDHEVTKKKRDLKENFDYHGQASHENTLGGQLKLNLWPSNEEGRLEQYGLTNFEMTLKTFYQTQSELAGKVMHLICRAMGANPQDLDEIFGDAHMSASRLNYYPSEDPIPESERQNIAALGELALGEHTDPNGITLLFQDNVGGLQAFSRDSGWIDVDPVPYSFVVNIGDVMQAWSNDRYKAAQHRVKAVPKDTPRISIPYFHMPKSGAVIKTIIKDENPHYRDFIWDEYLIARLEDNYAVIEREDTQISDYRI